MKEVTVRELDRMRRTGEAHQLIDVREKFEADLAPLGGTLLPMGEIEQHVDQIARDKKVVVHCRSGGRSGRVVQLLEKKYGFDNLYNLQGGSLAWSDEIDPAVPKY